MVGRDDGHEPVPGELAHGDTRRVRRGRQPEERHVHRALPDLLDQVVACRAHSADWAYLSPPALLAPGRRTGTYRRGTTTLLVDAEGVSRVSAEDLAVAVLDELENLGEDRHFTVGY
ncbi:hypothetical protein GCM10022245_20270 [Streptomyces mayteni]